jgi:hypothetical protein
MDSPRRDRSRNILLIRRPNSRLDGSRTTSLAPARFFSFEATQQLVEEVQGDHPVGGVHRRRGLAGDLLAGVGAEEAEAGDVAGGDPVDPASAAPRETL